MCQSQVLAVHLPRRNLGHQRVHGLARAGHDHQAAGVLVQPVHDARAGHLKGFGVQGQQAIEQRAAPVARSRVHHQTCWFVDHAQVRVLVHHVDGHGLGHKGL